MRYPNPFHSILTAVFVTACIVSEEDVDSTVQHRETGPGASYFFDREACDGVDNDCDGQIDESEDLSPPYQCLQLGVCAGTVETCTGATGWACEYANGHEAHETLCDRLDNDCDGEIDEDVCIQWVRIEGGEFDMGSEVGLSDERPVHTVTVPSFNMSRTEITVAQYSGCVTTGSCDEPRISAVRNPCNWGVDGRSTYPMNCLDWHKAGEFCAWVGGRLPSEAEWEYAARSEGRDQTYPWGDEEASCERAVMMDDVRTYNLGCGEDGTWPVCSKPAGNTAQDLCDMGGNASEWIADVYVDSYHGAPGDGTARTGRGPFRVVRGGSYSSSAYYVEAADRGRYPHLDALVNLGFRCVRSIEM